MCGSTRGENMANWVIVEFNIYQFRFFWADHYLFVVVRKIVHTEFRGRIKLIVSRIKMWRVCVVMRTGNVTLVFVSEIANLVAWIIDGTS